MLYRAEKSNREKLKKKLKMGSVIKLVKLISLEKDPSRKITQIANIRQITTDPTASKMMIRIY